MGEKKNSFVTSQGIKNGYLRRVSLEKNVNLVVLPNHQENHEIARFHSRNLKLLENFTLL